MPQFKHISAVKKVSKLCDIVSVEILCVVSTLYTVAYLSLCEICEVL